MAEYRPGCPVVVRVRRRGGLYDIDDGGAAVELAGRPPGWLDVCRRLVVEEGLNIDRGGRVFVQGRDRRDVQRLQDKVAAMSRAAYLELLERFC